MPYAFLFRNRWAALFWAATVLVGVYMRMPRDNADAPPPQEQAKPANPWAKDQ